MARMFSLYIAYLQEERPKLTNIFESMEVPFPPAGSDVRVGNYVYMAPETFPPKSKRYSDAADVYGLGNRNYRLSSA